MYLDVNSTLTEYWCHQYKLPVTVAYCLPACTFTSCMSLQLVWLGISH